MTKWFERRDKVTRTHDYEHKIIRKYVALL